MAMPEYKAERPVISGKRGSITIAQLKQYDVRYERVKRIMDIVGAAAGLLVVGLIMLIVAILIKCSDLRSPILFRQVRIGRAGQPFVMYKFRSMKRDAEESLPELLERNEIQGAMFKLRKDPRVTRIGRFIRKTSIDELPQLWNVIRGEMSLVGPRPPLPREVEQYTPYDLQRLSVMPGCTGLWQVSGRNGLNFNQMVELDLLYINTQSIRNDIIILLRTFKALIGKDAY
jgi:lipopolysaccharide/colanic/teichoic acid biosynthesis glycosyltransferase